MPPKAGGIFCAVFTSPNPEPNAHQQMIERNTDGREFHSFVHFYHVRIALQDSGTFKGREESDDAE